MRRTLVRWVVVAFALVGVAPLALRAPMSHADSSITGPTLTKAQIDSVKAARKLAKELKRQQRLAAKSGVVDSTAVARADSLAAAHAEAKRLAKEQSRTKQRTKPRKGSEKVVDVPFNVTGRLDSLAAAGLRKETGQPAAPAPAAPVVEKKGVKTRPPKVEKPHPSRTPKPARIKPAPSSEPAPMAQAPSAPKAGPLPRTLSPLDAQRTDEIIAGDLGAIDAWQGKLASLPGAADDEWRAAAAKAWLEAAEVEYTDNDRNGFPQAAFERGVALISDIEAGKAPVDSSNAPAALIPRGSVRVADSLYAKLDSLKHNPGFRCARDPIAQLEVELAWTGNEQLDQGDCRTSPHLARASELARVAQEAVERCVPAPVAAAVEPPMPVPAPDTVAAGPVPTKEELKIPRNVHFALNEFTISATSRQVVVGIAALLEKYPSITVRLVGHTDSRGSPDYNLSLSRRRVDAARAVFVELGIDSTRLSTDYRGKSELYAIEDSNRGFALNRRVEMVFVDSQGRDIRGEAQEGDLQLEAAKAAGAKPATHRPIAKKPAAGAAKRREK